MGRFGMFLLGCAVLGFMVWGMKSAYDKMYEIMNTTVSVNMTPTEDVLWRAMPIIIPAILFVILVLHLTGYIERKKERF